jgi:hypothetical protein
MHAYCCNKKALSREITGNGFLLRINSKLSLFFAAKLNLASVGGVINGIYSI